MKRLEQSLDTSLLVRSRNGVQLTRSGLVLAEHSRKLLADWEQLKSNVVRAGTDMIGTFSIGCHPSVALYTLPKLIPALKTQFPKLTINLTHDLSRKVTEQVVSFEVDFGLVINPIQHPDLVIHKLFLDEVTLWGEPEFIAANLKNNHKTVVYCDPNLKQSQTLLKFLDKDMFNIEFSK